MTPAEQPVSVRNEQVLERQLSSVQQTMLAIGGAIGTGLFLSTRLSVSSAGPAIIVSYVIVAGISLLLGRAVSEMAVAHPHCIAGERRDVEGGVDPERAGGRVGH